MNFIRLSLFLGIVSGSLVVGAELSPPEKTSRHYGRRLMKDMPSSNYVESIGKSNTRPIALR